MNDCVRDPKAYSVTIIKRFGVPWWYMDYDDLISEGYLGYMAAENTYDSSKSSFSHWAYVKMRCYILNYLVRKSSKNLPSIEDIKNEPKKDDFALEMFDLYDAIQKLPQRTQEVLKLQYWEGLNHSEIAKRCKLSKSMISYIHVKALDELRRLL